MQSETNTDKNCASNIASSAAPTPRSKQVSAKPLLAKIDRPVAKRPLGKMACFGGSRGVGLLKQKKLMLVVS